MHQETLLGMGKSCTSVGFLFPLPSWIGTIQLLICSQGFSVWIVVDFYSKFPSLSSPILLVMEQFFLSHSLLLSHTHTHTHKTASKRDKLLCTYILSRKAGIFLICKYPFGFTLPPPPRMRQGWTMPFLLPGMGQPQLRPDTRAQERAPRLRKTPCDSCNEMQGKFTAESKQKRTQQRQHRKGDQPDRKKPFQHEE